MDGRPIGIFDSGMGGLSVRAELARRFPDESLFYFGDGKNCPYGRRSREEIIRFTDEGIALLADKGIKMAVIACNAATAAAIDHLRGRYDFPIVGMEPAVKPAALASRSGVIGVLATAAAFNGELYRATAQKYGQQVEIIEIVGDGFVELVEEDREDTPEAFETVRRAVEPMIEAGADHIVLGCTHYPFLAAQIVRAIGGRNVRVIDSAPAIARRVDSLLAEHSLRAPAGNIPRHGFFTGAGREYLDALVRKSARVPDVTF